MRSRARGWRGASSDGPAARPQERPRARASARHRHARHAAAQPRLPRRDEGQVAPQQAARRGALGRARPASGSSATTASPNGSPPTPAATPRPTTSAAATPGASLEGWDEDYTRQMESWLAPPQLPEPFCLCSRSSIPTTCSASPTPTCPGGYAVAGVPRPGRPAAADAGGGPAREARRAGALEAGHGQLPRPPAATVRPSRTTSTSTPTCTGSWTATIGRLLRALGSRRGPRPRCARARS